MYVIGIDLGGTKLNMAAVDELGTILQRTIVPTNVAGGVEAIKGQIVMATQELVAKVGGKPKALGLGLAGQIHPTTGLVHFAPNLKWEKVPIREMLERDVGMTVAVLNDVRAATLGEWRFGAGRDCNDFVCIFVGTGIGAGIVSGGHLLTGANNSAGEVGHMIIQMDGRVCSCTRQGCFEAYASGWAIHKRAVELFGDSSLTAREIFELYKKGDEKAQMIVDEVTKGLIVGSVNVINCLNPERLIFGGGIIKGLPEILTPVREGITRLGLESATMNLTVCQAELAGDAGVIGAAVYAFDKI